MRLDPDQVPPGPAADLLRFIRGPKDEGSVPDFADEHGISRMTLQKLFKGRLQHLDVRVALAIEKATKGEIPVARWQERFSLGEGTLTSPPDSDPNDTIPGAPPSAAE